MSKEEILSINLIEKNNQIIYNLFEGDFVRKKEILQI